MKVSQITQTTNCKYNVPKTLDFRVKYKTQKCRYWEQQGYCPFGQICAFVHDCLQMRPKDQIHEHYKTKPCLNFNKHGYCKYGERCLFLHYSLSCDKDRTRSNSPVSPNTQIKKPTTRHLQNLKILQQFGISVFQAHINRPRSRIISSCNYQQCNRTSVSTQPEQPLCQDVYEPFIEDFNMKFRLQNEEDLNIPIQNKKIRMYSM